MSTLKPSNSLAGNIAPVSSFNLNAIAGSKSESLGAIVGRSLGLGIGLATHSPPAGAPGLDTLQDFLNMILIILRETPIHHSPQ